MSPEAMLVPGWNHDWAASAVNNATPKVTINHWRELVKDICNVAGRSQPRLTSCPQLNTVANPRKVNASNASRSETTPSATKARASSASTPAAAQICRAWFNTDSIRGMGLSTLLRTISSLIGEVCQFRHDSKVNVQSSRQHPSFPRGLMTSTS